MIVQHAYLIIKLALNPLLTGLDPNSTVEETTLLIEAIAVAKSEEIVELLLDHGENPKLCLISKTRFQMSN